MNLENLIRELRIDWEDLLSTPLKKIPPSSPELNTIFHKIEQAMDIIVERSFNSFSTTLLSYSHAHKEIKKQIENLESQIAFCEQVEESNPVFDSQEKSIKSELWVRKICTVILIVKNTINSIDNAIIHKNGLLACNLFQKIQNLFEEYKLGRVECLNGINAQLKERRKSVVNCICNDIESFLNGRKAGINYKSLIEASQNINCLQDLDTYVHKNIEKIFYSIIKDCIAFCTTFNIFGRQEETQENFYKNFAAEISHATSKFFDKLICVSRFALPFFGEPVDNFFGIKNVEQRIFNRNYEEVLGERLYKMYKRVVEQCTLGELTGIEEGFKLEDIVEKHSNIEIGDYIKLENQRLEDECEKPPKMPFPPFLESIFFFIDTLDNFGATNLAAKLSLFFKRKVNEKYFGVKNQRVERKLLFLFRSEDAFQYDIKSGLMYFYCQMDFKSIFRHKKENDVKFFDFIFEMILRKTKIYFLKYFKPEHTTEIFRVVSSNLENYDGTEPVLPEFPDDLFGPILKAYFSEKVLKNNNFFERSRYRQGVSAVKTLEGLLRVYKDEMADNVNEKRVKSYEELIINFKVSLQIQLIYEILFYFKKFLNDKSSFEMCAAQISRIVNDFLMWSDDKEYFKWFFSVANFYVSKNLSGLKGAEIKNVNLIDEILCEVKSSGEDNLKIAVDLLMSLEND